MKLRKLSSVHTLPEATRPYSAAARMRTSTRHQNFLESTRAVSGSLDLRRRGSVTMSSRPRPATASADLRCVHPTEQGSKFKQKSSPQIYFQNIVL